MKSSYYYNICIPKDLDVLFTYSLGIDGGDIEIGQLVIVNFRNRDMVGVVFERLDDPPSDISKIKMISSILPYAISRRYVDFIKFVANYNINTVGSILSLVIPFSIDNILSPEKKIKSIVSDENEDIELSDEQKECVKKISKNIDKFSPILLKGITGSGKTEVYIDFIKKCLKFYENDGQFLILVPEVSLSHELAKKVASRLHNFKDLQIFIWHHSITSSKKRDIWKKVLNGERIIVIGARSALFLPFQRMRCIIVDEEHDISFKQSESSIIYNARDMAVYLARLLDIPIILSSATPSIESYVNCQNEKYEYIELNHKFFSNNNDNSNIEIIIDDQRKKNNNQLLSDISMNIIEDSLKNNRQSMIFVNRRGHTPKILCSSCGSKIMCPACETWLCYHKDENKLVCHHCGFKRDVIERCPECGSESIIGIGMGIEKAYEEISKIFHNSNILALSSDNMNSPKRISDNIKLIKDKSVDIIIGTQILAKGHNFPYLDSVIITSADSMMYGDDFRLSERMFQTLYQLSGRVGRSFDIKNPRVVIQTFSPDDRLLNTLKNFDIEQFYSQEINDRKCMGIPPFGKFVAFIIMSSSRDHAFSYAMQIVQFARKYKDIKVLGPIVPNLFKLRLKYRIRLLFSSQKNIQNYIREIMFFNKCPRDIKIIIDVDPYDFS